MVTLKVYIWNVRLGTSVLIKWITCPKIHKSEVAI